MQNLVLSPVLPQVCMLTRSFPSIPLPAGEERILLPAEGLSSLPRPQHPPGKGHLLLWQKICRVTEATSGMQQTLQSKRPWQGRDIEQTATA